MLLRGLPADASFRLSLLPEEERDWGTDAYLLAHVIDELRISRYSAAVAAGVKGLKRPESFPRPGSRVGGRLTAPPRQAVARVLAHHGITPRPVA